MCGVREENWNCVDFLQTLDMERVEWTLLASSEGTIVVSPELCFSPNLDIVHGRT